MRRWNRYMRTASEMEINRLMEPVTVLQGGKRPGIES